MEGIIIFGVTASETAAAAATVTTTTTKTTTTARGVAMTEGSVTEGTATKAVAIAGAKKLTFVIILTARQMQPRPASRTGRSDYLERFHGIYIFPTFSFMFCFFLFFFVTY